MGMFKAPSDVPRSQSQTGINCCFLSRRKSYKLICCVLISLPMTSSLVLNEISLCNQISNNRHKVLELRPFNAPSLHNVGYKVRNSPVKISRVGERFQLRQSLNTGDVAASENYEPLPNQPLKGSDPEKEFELNRGLAVDTLLQDYPYLFVKSPDFSIFRKDILLQDAQGFSVSGLQAYQLFFRIVRQVASTLFSTAQVSVILGDKYATDKSRIRLRWKVELNGRIESAESERKSLLKKMGFEESSPASSSYDATFVEGISVYKLDAKGMIISHTIQVTEPTMLAPLSAFRSLIPMTSHASLVPDIRLGHIFDG